MWVLHGDLKMAKYRLLNLINGKDGLRMLRKFHKKYGGLYIVFKAQKVYMFMPGPLFCMR